MTTLNWFITGASSGLGASLAKAAISAGHRVAGTARSSSRLRDLAASHPDTFLPLSMDLARPNEIEAAIAQAEAWHGGIDVLVNNAGIGYAAAIEEGEDKNVRAVFETNVFGLINIIRAALPAMRGRGRGTIVNISSTNGVVSMPGLGFYSASKHAVEAITDALRGEVAPLGLKVLTVEPGGFRTGIAGRNLRSRRIAAYDQTAHQIMDFLRVDNQDAYAKGDPDRMAKILVDLVGTGDMPPRLILGADSFGAITGELDARKAEYEKWKDTSFSTYFE
jgi:NAD(P)-dependent dehydrogenase (short-subunit alcohol dehydrogenase family)